MEIERSVLIIIGTKMELVWNTASATQFPMKWSHKAWNKSLLIYLECLKVK